MGTKNPPPLHPNILLVDDNHDGLIVRKTLLEEFGYRVAIADTPEEGLKLFEISNFDVVVTDYRMPSMSGTELIGQIRRLDPDARVILISGFVEHLGLTEQNTGADAIILKNSNEPVHLVRSVKRLLNRAPARKPPASEKTGLKTHAIAR